MLQRESESKDVLNEKEIEKKVEHVKINPLEEVETKEEVFKKVQTLCLIPDDPSHEPLETLPISTRHYFWTSFWFHERPDSRSPDYSSLHFSSTTSRRSTGTHFWIMKV